MYNLTMPPDITIRTYLPADYQQVKQLLAEGGLFDEILDSEDHLRRVIRKDKESILVAVDQKAIVGTISFNDGRMPMLFRLAVAESHRRRGIGTALLAKATSILTGRGSQEIGFLVNDKKEHLKSYYVSLGWKSGRNVFRWMYKTFKE